MTAKSFLFVKAWMKPLKALAPEQRWNVLEAIAEYSTSGEVTMPLDFQSQNQKSRRRRRACVREGCRKVLLME